MRRTLLKRVGLNVWFGVPVSLFLVSLNLEYRIELENGGKEFASRKQLLFTEISLR